jgi:hypothetical protein
MTVFGSVRFTMIDAVSVVGVLQKLAQPSFSAKFQNDILPSPQT